MSNGTAIVGVVYDLSNAVVSTDTGDTPSETRELQALGGFNAFTGRSMGLLGTLRCTRHLDQLEAPVSKIPLFVAAGMTGFTTMVALGSWETDISGEASPRDPSDQMIVAVLRGSTAAVVGVQAYLNRTAIRTLDPPPRRGPSLQLSVGAGHLGVMGQF